MLQKDTIKSNRERIEYLESNIAIKQTALKRLNSEIASMELEILSLES